MSKRRKADQHIAVGYIRVSTQEQHLGSEAQRSAIEAYARAHGLVIAEWHEDIGISGAAPMSMRPGLVAAMRAVRTLAAASLLLSRRDRLARDPLISLTVDRELKRHGARAITADGSSFGDGPTGELMRTIVDGMAQYERQLISARTAEALAAKRRRGERVSGSPPYGWRVGPDGIHLEPVLEEQDALVRIRQLRTVGLTLRAIAAQITEEGIRSRAGTPLSSVQVHRALSRRV
jgi:DNA invertase Pin-like site-specific DNA recombinase